VKEYYVYLLSSQKNGTLYTGLTSNLVKRVYEHKSKVADGFTAKYNVTNLVYFEVYIDINFAMNRESQLKRWRRRWKLALIEKENPTWRDLYEEIIA
jgi:putative endonuclease